MSSVLRRIGTSWLVVLADRICQRSSIHQALMPTANPHRHEEKDAHNSPLLRRVSDPFSKRPVVDNFQRGSRSIAAVRTRFYPQIWRKRQVPGGSGLGFQCPYLSAGSWIGPWISGFGSIHVLVAPSSIFSSWHHFFLRATAFRAVASALVGRRRIRGGEMD